MTNQNRDRYRSFSDAKAHTSQEVREADSTPSARGELHDFEKQRIIECNVDRHLHETIRCLLSILSGRKSRLSTNTSQLMEMVQRPRK
jgi:hypothetical protein